MAIPCPICGKSLQERTPKEPSIIVILLCKKCDKSFPINKGDRIKDVLDPFKPKPIFIFKPRKRYMKPKPVIIPLKDGRFQAIVIITDGQPKELGIFNTLDEANNAIRQYTRLKPRILRRKNTPRIKDNSIELAKKKLKQEIERILQK